LHAAPPERRGALKYGALLLQKFFDISQLETI
jgi:hypothetical protein